MGKTTKNLDLYLTDMDTDGNDYFDFERDLNQNWDKIDEFSYETREQITALDSVVVRKSDFENFKTTNTADLNKKADINLSNTTKTANMKIAHCAMPSKTRVANIFGSSLTTAYKTYTAPADGEIDIVASSDEYNALNILINDVTVCWQGTSAVGKTRTTFNRVVSKGDVIKARMDTRATTTLISYFNYANGTV